jgi:DNA-binding transcriptional ArsR family regulator
LTFHDDAIKIYLENYLNSLRRISDLGFPETFKALSDPVRREILELLKDGKMSAGDIGSRFDLTGATVSYHLSLLKKAGLIKETKYKNFIYYEIQVSVFEEIMLWASQFGKEKEQ